MVYRAYDPKLHREVAIKHLRAGADSEAGASLLVREAQAMAKLNHPNVVAVYDAETTDAGVLLAMEYVEGTTLARWLEQPNLPVPAETERFNLMQREARLFASSPLIPAHLRQGGEVQAQANCYIALKLAKTMGEDPLVVLQNIHIVSGKAGFSAQYMIAPGPTCVVLPSHSIAPVPAATISSSSSGC